MLSPIMRTPAAPAGRRAAPATPEAPAREGRKAPMGRDVLSLANDRNGDGALSFDEVPYDRTALRRFARLDRDGDGRLTADELVSRRRGASCRPPAETAPAPEADAAAPPAPEVPDTPATFGYTTRNPHPVSELAQQLSADLDALMAANGWTDPSQPVPAGSAIQVPDTQASRAMAAAYGGGPAGPAVAEVAEVADAAEAPAPEAGVAAGDVPPDSLEGQYGGQCVVFVETFTGHYFPVAYAAQMLDPGMHPGYEVVQTPRPGDVFVMQGGQYGHTGIVKAVNGDGTLTVVDSNGNYDEIIHVDSVYAQSSIAGYLRRDPAEAPTPYTP